MRLLEVLARESIKLPNTEGQRLIISDVTWQQYSTLVNVYTDEYPSLRMTYLNGVLEIMTTSNEHERLKKIFARLLEMYFVERQIDLNGYGQTTFRQELAQRGLEPDECYCFGELKEVPDIAIEIVISSGGIDKLEVYRGLGIPEVWFWYAKQQQWKLYRLREDDNEPKYELISRSEFLPELDFDLLSQFAKETSQTKAVIEYREALKKEEGKRKKEK
ncbi:MULTISPECIES: Uma2 family endonuclease [Pseudanabaena]|uniref:Uma2 family endonuclease n=1 Tax=Pseudanabaena TaxID=1152 RepID=UPI00247A31E5|nr:MULTISPECIES: Uma2 family endonuclease [Pseudanabaena]MEA5486799.1 Uma2 family endonuclease [Pseudanabaena sp. CCNP1317]WGS74803.1 Uma2 family endonuclease [Pseudanabaena galeata CCNP1313]